MAVYTGPSCAIKRAAKLAASERKVLFLHDDYENATILRGQMSELSKALDAIHFVSYMGNSPIQLRNLKRKTATTGSDELQTFGCLWYGGDQNRLKQLSFPHLNQLSRRKGPFYAVVAVGAACELARLVAVAHNCRQITLDLNQQQPSDKAGHFCPIFIASSTEFFTFNVIKPIDHGEVLDLPVEKITAFIAATAGPEREKQSVMFKLANPSRHDVQQRKLEQKQLAKELQEKKTKVNLERKALKARKAAGENVEVPPNTTRILREERQKLRTALQKMTANSQQLVENFENSAEPGVSNFIVAPMAEPVTPCTVEGLDGIIQYLRSNAKLSEDEIRKDFSRGSILNHGGMAVDLCKQVVGPEGIEPVLDAMGYNEHVVRFLLGNNVSGDRGAKAMAKFIADKERSKNVYNFYIAGNDIGPAGAAEIAQALQHDEKVRALWLKRNAIGPVGVCHLASTLLLNTTLETLDLVNVGMLDEGAVALFEALTKVVDSSGLRHLYVGSNALTAKSADAAATLLSTGKSKLKTLYFAAGRLGDEGVRLLSEGLTKDHSLQRLGLASERIGYDGAVALGDALQKHPRLISLDVGLRKGTFVLGELPNSIGDEGAVCLVKKLLADGRPAKFRYLDLSHNGISADALETLTDIVDQQMDQSLMVLRHRQRNVTWDSTRLQDLVKRNTARFKKLKRLAHGGLDEAIQEVDEVMEVLYPRHIFDIYSIYRNNM